MPPQSASHGSSVVHGGDHGTEVLPRTADRKKLADDFELSKTLARKGRVVLLAENQACIPERFNLAADAVINIDPVLPRHVIALARYTSVCISSATAANADLSCATSTRPCGRIDSGIGFGVSRADAV